MTENDLREIVSSWENLLFTIDYFSEHPEFLAILLNIAIDDSLKDSWRACWLINKIEERNPGHFKEYLHRAIDFVQKTSDRSKKREFLRLICLYEIPIEKAPALLDYCINQFTSADEPIAVRVHAMQVLFNISEVEPELKNELIQLIEHEIEYHSSAGIRSRGGKLLRKLNKQVLRSAL